MLTVGCYRPLCYIKETPKAPVDNFREKPRLFTDGHKLMKMTLVQRAWFVLVFSTVFLILCVVQLDRRTKWLWHLVFIPLWILDAVVITALVVLIIMHFKSGRNPYPDINLGKRRKIWLLYLTLLKLAFLLALCARLDGLTDAAYVQIFIPLWLLLLSLAGDAILATVKSARPMASYGLGSLPNCQNLYIS